jgi:hypothetical protein
LVPRSIKFAKSGLRYHSNEQSTRPPHPLEGGASARFGEGFSEGTGSTSIHVLRAPHPFSHSSLTPYHLAKYICDASAHVCGASTHVCEASAQPCEASTHVCEASAQPCGASTRVCGASAQTCGASTHVCGAPVQTCGASTHVCDASAQTHDASARICSLSVQLRLLSPLMLRVFPLKFLLQPRVRLLPEIREARRDLHRAEVRSKHLDHERDLPGGDA